MEIDATVIIFILISLIFSVGGSIFMGNWVLRPKRKTFVAVYYGIIGLVISPFAFIVLMGIFNTITGSTYGI